jgi:solute:Na+ symporter, SSS family
MTGQSVAFLILGPYLVAILATGYFVRRRSTTSSAFLHARNMLPISITSVAFLAANCGALEIVGMVAASAKYGLPALHFYWIGAIPAMVFLALFMLPIYRHSRALTVPDFLRIRYNNATHILSASCLAAMMALIAGIGLYAISSVLHLFFGWSFLRLVLLASGFVVCYVVSGGLRATIYNEVFQFTLTIVGLVPLMVKVLRDFRGTGGLQKELPFGMTHIWSSLPLMRPQTATLDVTGVVLGLGLVLSFGYWCTDFLLIQRALAARNMRESIQTPLIAGVFKLFFPALLVIPGLAAAVFFRKNGVTRYDQALPFVMQHYYGPALLGLGISAIIASLMSGLAGNISALSALWTHDLYRSHINRNASDQHYLRMGRISTVVATVLAIATASIAFHFNSLMDYLTLLFSLFNAPLFAAFLLGMFTTWATPAAGFWGLLAGVVAAIAHNIAVRSHVIGYGSDLLASFYGAAYGFGIALATIALISAFTRRKSLEDLAGVTYFTCEKESKVITPGIWVLAGCIIVACIALNFIFR